MTALIGAALAQLGIVLAVGFLLGVGRVVVGEARLGKLASLMLDLPAMLMLSWLACGWTIERFAVDSGRPHRAAIGGSAFALLMVAELGVSVLRLGRSATAHVHGHRSRSAALGLGGPLAFALFALIGSRPAAGSRTGPPDASP
jgi:hypothetical protein